MEQNFFSQPSSIPQASESFGKVPQSSETFRNIPNTSEPFGTFPKDSESFGRLRKESHTLTVRDAARMFEAAGVSRTERSITNWCHQNAMGVARLDAYFDPNERRYFISQLSIESAIAEERAKAFRNGQNPSENPIKARPEENTKNPDTNSFDQGEPSKKTKALEQEVLDLKILNSGKDFFIEQLKEERKSFLEQLVEGSKRIGELETKLLQLGEARSIQQIDASQSAKSG